MEKTYALSDIPHSPTIGLGSISFFDRSCPSFEAGIGRLFTSSGSAAIGVALSILGVRSGDEVLFPTYHCPSMIAPAEAIGATPVFYPIDALGMPNMEFLEALDISKVKAIIVVHFFGFRLVFDRIKDFCNKNDIVVIEDFAHALSEIYSCRIENKNHLAVASLSKFFPTLEGGWVVGPLESLKTLPLKPRSFGQEILAAMDLLEIGSRYRRFGAFNAIFRAIFATKSWIKKLKSNIYKKRGIIGITGDACTRESTFSIYTNAISLANLLVVKYSNCENIRRARRNNCDLLIDLLSNVEKIRVLGIPLLPNTVPYVLPILIDSGEKCYKVMKTLSLPVFRWDFEWPGTPQIEGDVGRRWKTELIQVACHQDMTEQDVRRVAESISNVVAETCR
jgi:perosamine synthetase